MAEMSMDTFPYGGMSQSYGPGAMSQSSTQAYLPSYSGASNYTGGAATVAGMTTPWLPIAGAFLDLGSQYLNRQEARRQFERQMQQQMDLAKHGLGYRIDDAVSRGLHPLTGAGVSPASSGASPTVSGSMHSGFGQAGSASALNALQSQLMSSNIDAINASAEESRARSINLTTQSLNNVATNPKIKAEIDRVLLDAGMTEKELKNYNVNQLMKVLGIVAQTATGVGGSAMRLSGTHYMADTMLNSQMLRSGYIIDR